MNDVLPHEIEWTPERVKRFWDFYSTNPGLEDAYFARMVGPALVKYVAKKIAIGTAIDIGCGPGDLISELLRRGYNTFAADSSPASLAKVKALFAGAAGFRGAVLMEAGAIDLASTSTDTAFMLEVVEHMDDSALTTALKGARDILRAGGHLVLTTPNNEDLDASRVMCPECGGIFHRIQHVRAWSEQTLRAFVEPLGFSTLTCEATILPPYTNVLGTAYRVLYPLIRGRKPHLIYIGRKSPG